MWEFGSNRLFDTPVVLANCTRVANEFIMFQSTASMACGASTERKKKKKNVTAFTMH
jgi:hypothetical protein